MRERRRWLRLPLAIPVFVHAVDGSGKEFTEFATTLNISAGGAFIALHRYLRRSTVVSLEIPCSVITGVPGTLKTQGKIRAKVVNIVSGDGCHLSRMKFTRPLVKATAALPRRKAAS